MPHDHNIIFLPPPPLGTSTPQSPTPEAWPSRHDANPVWYVLYLLFVRTHTKFGIKVFEIGFVIEIKWYLTFGPSPGPQGAGPKTVWCCTPIHVSNSHTKFGWISSNGLRGDSITDRRTDGRRRLQYPLRFFKKAWGYVYMYNYIDNVYIGVVTCQFFKFITVMALNWSLNFVSAQYLQDTCSEIGEILHILWLLPVSFLQLVTYGPWVMPIRNPFPLDIVRTNGRGTKVAYRAKTHIFCTRKVYSWIFVYW